MSIIDKLLCTDDEKLKGITKKTFEVKRLSEIIGEPFILELNQLTKVERDTIVNSDCKDLDTLIVSLGAKIEGKDIGCQELLDRFDCVTSIGVVDKLFTLGEIQVIADQIQIMSGYKDNVLKEIKN